MTLTRLIPILAFLLASVTGLAATTPPPSVDPATLVREAKTQIGKTKGYDPAYRKLAYPGGDIPIESGVCTDVIVRALRSAGKVDLQKLVHEDMKRAFKSYPQLWGLKGPDSNIDHRRVPNLQTFFKRQGWSLPVTDKPADYKAGDIVTCIIPPNLPHIMIVSDTQGPAGRPLVIHNIGAGTREEEGLFFYKLSGHYRLPPKPAPKQ